MKPIAPAASMKTAPEPGLRIRVWLLRVRNLLLMGVLSFSIPPILLTLGSYIYFQSTDRILPNVVAAEVTLGGRSLEEAARLIDEHWNQSDNMLVVDLHDPARSWVDQAASFGLSVDSAGTAMLAFKQGREGSGIQSIWNMLSVLRTGAEIEALVSLDPVKAQSQFEAWALRVELSARDDNIWLDGRNIIVETALDGKAVDVLASLDLLISDTWAFRIEHQMIPLVMVPIPARRYETHPALETLGRIRSMEASLRAYDPVTDEHFAWSPLDADFATWIEITPENGRFSVALLPAPVRAFVEQINVSLGGQRVIDVDQAVTEILKAFSGEQIELVSLRYRPGTYIVQPGDNLVSISFEIGMPYWKLHEANPDLARRGLVVGEELVVPPKDDMLSLPITPGKRIVISILEQRMEVYESGKLIHEYVISTGIPSSPTLPGIFQISSHFENAYASIWDLTMPHFMGIYDAVPGLTNGIHGLPMLSSGRRLWAEVLGNPASYGCIILDLEAAERLFYWAEEGVVVEIRN
jgi:hypothetical protein